MSPAPRKPAAAAPRKRAAAKPGGAAPPSPPNPAPPATSSGAGAPVASGAASATRAPVPSAGTGVIMAGGSAGAPLPSLTRKRPPSSPVAAPLAATVAGPTPGVALPRGGALDEPWPKPLQIERVVPAPLESGLSDYAFWTEYLADHEPAPAPPGGFRRGRVWR